MNSKLHALAPKAYSLKPSLDAVVVTMLFFIIPLQ